MTSTIKADVVTAQAINGNVTLQGNGTGTVAISDNTAITGTATVSSTLGVTGATTLSSTLGVTGATTLGTNSSGNYALTMNPVGDQSNALNFKLSGDTASQYEAMSWKNNSGTVVANIWKTGDPATTAPLRINSLGTIELRSEDVGIDGDAPIVKVSGSHGANDGAVNVNDRWQVNESTPASAVGGTEQVIMARTDNNVGSLSSRNFVFGLPSITSAVTVATITPSATSGAWGRMAVAINYCGGHTGSVGDGFVAQRVFGIRLNGAGPIVDTAVAGTSYANAPAVTITLSGTTVLIQVASNDGSNTMGGALMDMTLTTHTTAGAGITWTVT